MQFDELPLQCGTFTSYAITKSVEHFNYFYLEFLKQFHENIHTHIHALTHTNTDMTKISNNGKKWENNGNKKKYWNILFERRLQFLKIHVFTH